MSNLRCFKEIPIFIVEDHNEVLIFIYQCLASRYLPFNDNIIVHFDSHPDLTIPRSMPANCVYNRNELLDTLSIENWIMPTTYAGHFSNIVWLKPHWSKQIPSGRHNFQIGDHKHFIRTDCSLEYFVSEGTYQPTKNLTNQRSVVLQVQTIGERKSEDLIDKIRDLLSESKPFVLDIDLDFFSTRNPFLDIYNKAGNIYGSLKEIFAINYREDFSPDQFLKCSTDREQQLDNLQTIFTHLDLNKTVDNFEYPPNISPIWTKILELIQKIKSFYEEDDIDWMMVYNAGCTWDRTSLPHHESSELEILKLLKEFKEFISQLPTPTVVTISRSSDDDYCPKNRVEFIQEHVLKTLNQVYGDKITDTPILYYNDEDWFDKWFQKK